MPGFIGKARLVIYLTKKKNSLESNLIRIMFLKIQFNLLANDAYLTSTFSRHASRGMTENRKSSFTSIS